MYVSIILVTFLLGPYFWSYIADRYGRMKSFKTEIYVVFVGAAGMTFSFNLGMLIGFAAIMGFGVAGEQALGGTVFKEFIPASKGRMMSILMISFIVGFLITASLAMIACDFQFAELAGWRWLCIVLLVLELGFIAMRLQMRETPFFLASQGRYEEAQEVLNTVGHRQMSLVNRGLPLQESLLSEGPSINDLPSSETPHRSSSQLGRLFQQDLIQSTVVFGAVRTRQFDSLHSLAVVGITIFMPEILAEVGSGTESCFLTFMVYSVQQVTNMPATLIAYKLLDTRLGRRLSIVIFTTVSGVFMFSFLLVKDLAGVTLTQIIVVSSLCSALNFMGLQPSLL
jgi:MFS family permease